MLRTFSVACCGVLAVSVALVVSCTSPPHVFNDAAAEAGAGAEAGSGTEAAGGGGASSVGGTGSGGSCTSAGGCECEEGQTQPCGPAEELGICRRGKQTCVDGAFGACEGAVTAKIRDCTSPLDNDCDGSPDDTMDAECLCAPGATRACGEHPGLDGNGPCMAGEQACVESGSSGVWGPCVGSVGPEPTDRCDIVGDDSNCDSETNGGCTCMAGDVSDCSAIHDAQGACAAIALVCASSGNWPGAASCGTMANEVCADDSMDEDCDGQVNEGCACTNGATEPCGACGAGTRTCAGGAWGACSDVSTLTTPRGSKMRCVAGGAFNMGSVSGSLPEDTRPVHSVTLPGFWMDETEVTAAHYDACVSAGACSAALKHSGCNSGVSGRGQHPINCVHQPQAVEFCEWADKRLPIEEEWEYAARGNDGRSYPWGNAVPTTQAHWNAAAAWPDGTVPVGGYASGKSPFGLFDMAGNVQEWTASQWCPYPTAGVTPACGTEVMVYRGGGYNSTEVTELNVAYRRYDAAFWEYSLGFRCAKTL